jgi:hypothetical protein
MKYNAQKSSHKQLQQSAKKIVTWDDLVGIAGYKGPRKSIREIQLESARGKKK